MNLKNSLNRYHFIVISTFQPLNLQQHLALTPSDHRAAHHSLAIFRTLQSLQIFWGALKSAIIIVCKLTYSQLFHCLLAERVTLRPLAISSGELVEHETYNRLTATITLPPNMRCTQTEKKYQDHGLPKIIGLLSIRGTAAYCLSNLLNKALINDRK